MQARYDEFRSRGAEILAISSSPVDGHGKIARKIEAAFPILSDPEGKVMRDYGVLHPGGVPGFGAIVARPAVLCLDSQGVVRERFLTDNWRVRVRPENLLEALDRLKR